MVINKVALLGIRGRLGPWLLKSLVESGKFQITVLQRAKSTATLPREYQDKLRVVELASEYFRDTDGLAKQLEGQEAVVVSMPASNVKEQDAIMNACVKAGVRRMIPADYGSVDSSDEVCVGLIPSVYGNKKYTRDMLRATSVKHPNFSWTSLVCGHFFDYGLESDLLAFSLSTDPCKVLIFDDGDTKWSASTRDRIGEAVVAILEREVETANRMLYIQSFCTSQNEVLELLENITGKKFEISKAKSDDYIKQKKQEMDEGIGHDPMDEMVAVLGLTRADWTKYPDFANEALGLKEESLEEEIRKVCERKQFHVSSV